MKTRIIIALCICLAITVTACSQRGDTKEPIQSSSTSSSESSSNSAISHDESSEQNGASSIPSERQSSDISSTVPSSAAPAQAIIEPTIETVYIELDRNSIKIDEISSSLQVPYIIRNNSSKDVNTGSDYTIEKYNGNDWTAFPFNELEQPNWTSVMIPIPEGSTMEGNLSYWVFEEDMLPGTYRLVKRVGEEGKDRLTLYAEFSVAE